MAYLINLRTVRKRKNRADKEKKAEQNRLYFGRTKHDKNLTNARQDLATKNLDGHKNQPRKTNDHT